MTQEVHIQVQLALVRKIGDGSEPAFRLRVYAPGRKALVGFEAADVESALYLATPHLIDLLTDPDPGPA